MILQRSLLTKYLSRQEQLEAKFREFHRDNPCVYNWFRAFSLELIRRGIKQYSAYGIMHRVRFEAVLTGVEDNEYKINNNLTPYYARKFLRDHPQHKGFFITRELTTENRGPDNE